MSNQKSAFVAYSTRDKAVGDKILNGVRKANAVGANPVRFEPWEFNDIAGETVVSPILSKIEDSPFVVADITYLNLNVVYEIGFAIGRNKKVFLLKDTSVAGDGELAKRTGIFDTLGYFGYSTDEDIRNRLTGHIDETALPLTRELDRQAPVYLMEPPERSDAATKMVSRIKKARFKYRSFISSEDIRLSATDAIRQVGRSSGVCLMIESKGGSIEEHNVRTLFVAGLAHGMLKPTLIFSPAGYDVPLDIRDEIVTYNGPQDIPEHVATFCPQINDSLQGEEATKEISKGFLDSIWVGDPTAENEMTTLADYYLQTDEFLRASSGDVNLVVGRKGSGKTALFISLRDLTRADKRNIVVDLKPESYQLAKLKDEILSLLAAGSRQHLLTAFWEYLILLEVAYKLLEKDQKVHRFNHDLYDIYQELEQTYRGDDSLSEGDFSERLLALSRRLSEQFKLKFANTGERGITIQQITEILYSHDLKNLKAQLSNYLKHKGRVLVLFDNLDKSWSTDGVDTIDSITLRCLIDAGRKIERDMQKAGHAFRCVLFLRNDVYKFLMANSSDYGKEMRATLDWSDPDLLREMLRLRLSSSLPDEYAKLSFDELWKMISVSHVFGEESSDFIISRSLMRPRNVLKLFNHIRGFAVNFRREKITTDDFYKGLVSYSQDLLVELDREISDVYPDAKDLLYYFIDTPSELSRDDLFKIFSEAGIDGAEHGKIRNFLIYHGVLGLQNGDDAQYIFDVGYDLKPMQIRAQRAGEAVRFTINPAFTPALEITDAVFNSQENLAI